MIHASIRSARTALRPQRRVLFVLAVVFAVGAGLGAWHLHETGSAQASVLTARAGRGDVTVVVGGLGRIVDARGASRIAAATGTPATGAGSAGGPAPASASADSVFPRASGHVARLLVAEGQHVVAGQALAVLNDGGSADAAVTQARDELSTARLELLQKRTSDPQKGSPATPAELSAARLAVTAAHQRLTGLLGPPRPAEVSRARSDLKRAQADLEALLGGAPEARARMLGVARRNVELAQQRLDKILAPPNAADVSAAQAEVKRAEADLADLRRPKPEQPPPSAEALAAAQAAVDAARERLARALAPPDPADVTAARLELERAQAEQRGLEAGPSDTALAAARQAVDANRKQLAQLLGEPQRADVTAARVDVRKSEADLAVLQARGGPASSTDIALSQLKVEAAHARLTHARVLRRELTVRAPSDGTVTAVFAVRGAPVDVSTPIAAVADLGHLAVSLDLSEFDVSRVERGMRAVVRVDALGGRRFPGKVLFESLTGVDNGGVVTFPVRVGLTRFFGIKPGMNVSVRIVVARRHRVVRVPLGAVSREGGRNATVTVVDASGRQSTRSVQLGLSDNKNVEVRTGLRPGERVVLASAEGA